LGANINFVLFLVEKKIILLPDLKMGHFLLIAEQQHFGLGLMGGIFLSFLLSETLEHYFRELLI
jgi:hypothetical protein